MATANYAIHLDGSTQYCTMADNACLDYATGGAFTIGIWVRPDWDYITQAAKQYIFHRANQHSLYVENGNLVYYINGASGALTWVTEVQLRADKTSFICLTGSTVTNTTLTLYMDGVSQTTATLTGALPSDTNTILYTGAYYSGSASLFLKGNITGFIQSNTTALSAANVLLAWNSGVYSYDVVNAITGLIDHVAFTENTGTAYGNSLGTGPDWAGVGTPTWVRTIDPMQKHDISGVTGLTREFTGVGQNTHQTLMIKKIKFMDATAADQACELTNWNGDIIYRDESNADDYIRESDYTAPSYLTTQGLKVATLGGGRVFITLA